MSSRLERIGSSQQADVEWGHPEFNSIEGLSGLDQLLESIFVEYSDPDEDSEALPLEGVIIAFDLDGTLKHLAQSLKRVTAGEVNQGSLNYLAELETKGASIVIATNNPLEQHWLTRNKIKKSLEESLADPTLYYPQTLLLWPFKPWHEKRNQDHITELAFQMKRKIDQPKCLVMVGDSPSDTEFGQKLADKLEISFASYQLKSIWDFLPDALRDQLPV